MERRKRRWYRLDSRGISNLVVVCSGILLYLGLTHLTQVKAVIDDFLNVLFPFIAGFIIAYLLNSPANFFEKQVYKGRKKARILAIVTVFAITLIIIVILLNLILPQVGDSLFRLLSNVSYYLKNLDDMVQQLFQKLDQKNDVIVELVQAYKDLMRKVAEQLTAAIPDLFNFGVAVGNGVVTAITAVISSVYMLAGKERLTRHLKKLLYAIFPARGVSHILRIGSKANQIFVGFIYGKLLDSAIIGLLCFLLSTLIRIPYAILISVIIGVTNVIPFFGPIIGAVPCLMILFIVDPWAALRFGVLIIVLQQFDGNILGPKILGDSTGLSAIWVLVAIVVGGGLFGFPGMLLGVPTFAVLYSLMREWTDQRLARKGINADGEPVNGRELPDDTAT